MRLFEEGVKLSDACKKELEAAEGKIQLLVEQRSGAMKVVDFDPEGDAQSRKDQD